MNQLGVLEAVEAYERISEQLDLVRFASALAVALASALAVAWLYRAFCESRGTGSQLWRAFPALSLAITTLFLCIQISIPLSLGLLGSLSIIRFRTPIKEPEEVGFVMLVIAAAICAATQQFDFILYLYLFALAALVAARGAAAMRWLRRDGVLVLTLPAADALAKAPEIARVLAEHLPRHVLESASTRNGMSTNQYVFGGLRDADALQKALFDVAPFAAVNVFLDRPGGIR